MKYLLNRLHHLNLMGMPVIWYPLLNSVPEKKDNKLGVVRKKDVINHVKN